MGWEEEGQGGKRINDWGLWPRSNTWDWNRMLDFGKDNSWDYTGLWSDGTESNIYSYNLTSRSGLNAGASTSKEKRKN